MRIQRALVVALTTAALGSAMAGPVDVGYSVSGAPGAWQVDFTFANNLSSPVSLYFVGVKSDGFLDTPLPPFIRAFGSTFNSSDAGGLDITYNNLWLDLGLTGLPKGHSLSGFTVDFLTPSLPSSFEWFAMTRGGTVTDPFDFGSPTAAGYQGLVSLPVPEPETYALFAGGLIALMARNRKRLSFPARR